MRYLIILLLSLLELLVTGCEFSIYNAIPAEKELRTLRLITNNPHGLLTQAITKQLRLSNIKLIINRKFKDTLVLKIINSSESIRTVSVYCNGRSAEKQLIFLINACIILPNNTVYPIKVCVERSFFDNPLETLAKDTESEFLKQEMLEEAASQLIHELLIIHSNAQDESK